MGYLKDTPKFTIAHLYTLARYWRACLTIHPLPRILLPTAAAAAVPEKIKQKQNQLRRCHDVTWWAYIRTVRWSRNGKRDGPDRSQSAATAKGAIMNRQGSGTLYSLFRHNNRCLPIMANAIFTNLSLCRRRRPHLRYTARWQKGIKCSVAPGLSGTDKRPHLARCTISITLSLSLPNYLFHSFAFSRSLSL